MRFLCLHGHGTNSRILETQLELLRATLPCSWEFEFLDGEFDAAPAPGVKAIFPGPYLCYHGEPIPKDVQHAHNLVLDVIREEGPFDGVIGFSQGAALAAAFIARQADISPSEEFFKVAVFIATSMPFDLDGDRIRLSYDGSSNLSAVQIDAEGQASHDDQCDWLEDCRSASVIQEFEGRRPSTGELKHQNIEILLRYHPSTHSQRIRIPTVHVVGIKDSYAEQGRDLALFCEPRKTQVVTHSGGHELPRDVGTVARVGEAIQVAVERVGFDV
ncbi:serine hydrolase FSH [Amylocarpus encephaloides]|uniref:Serine hydrolase FSH n=1 Tax=Amylocarpus encephaloides TaxID=45428 RepID=A0A9P7YT52_9HELO|nr:serine hydrolase FSH [Amylocarpus encephaloides]